MTISPSTPQQNRRSSQVYVEIPPSPYSRVRGPANPLTPLRSASLKENTAVLPSKIVPRTFDVNGINTPSSPFKRKLSSVEVCITSPKKFKLSASDACSRPAVKGHVNHSILAPASSRPANVSDEFPNGFFTCHQCSKRQDIAAGIQCTIRLLSKTYRPGSTKERRCLRKYCRLCLKKRYGEDADFIMARRRTINEQDSAHVGGVGYIFKCPKCRGICQCSRCKKAKCLASMRSHGMELERVSKPLPLPTWKSLHIELSLASAEARIQIREFVIRFVSLMRGISNNHVEELGIIVGKNRDMGDSDEDGVEEEWVSEVCVKAVLLGLLELIASSEGQEHGKIIKTAVKQIRGCSANLNKIWGILSSMRDSLSGSPITKSSPASGNLPLTFPDPSPLPAMFNIRVTRNQTSAGLIAYSTQMIPVLVALTNLAAQTDLVRENIETALKEERDWVKGERDKHKREVDRWEEEKKVLKGSGNKTNVESEKAMEVKRDAHNMALDDLKNTLKIAVFDSAPRFGPLGRDADGRVYWALSPGLAERDDALKILLSAKDLADRNSRKSTKGKRRGRGSEERRQMREWAWFVAVWGRKPAVEPGVVGKKQGNDDDDDDETDEDEEGWWGFWQPEEIKRLASWVKGRETPKVASSTAGSSREGSEDASNSSALGPPIGAKQKNLALALEEYATLLEWRIRKESVDEESSGERNNGRKLAVVPTSKFYA